MAEVQSKQSVPANSFLTTPPPAEEEDVTVQIEGTGAEEAEVDGKQDIADPVQQSESAENSATEEEARQAGWVTEEEWLERHPNKKGWRPASEFLEFRASFLPIQRRENQSLRTEVEQLKRQLAERTKAEDEARSQYERQNLKAQLKQAQEEGDWDKANGIVEKILDLKVAEKTPAAVSQPQKDIDPQLKADFAEFSGQNPWLKPGTRLAKLFAVHLDSIMRAGAADNPLDAMESAKKMLKASHPDEFPSTRRAPMAETGGQRGHNGSTRSWSQLTTQYRQEYDKFLDDNPKVKKEDILRELPAEAFRR